MVETDRSFSFVQIALVVVIIAIIGGVAGFVLGSNMLGSDKPDSIPTQVTFTTESSLYDDRIVHTFAPNHDEHREYHISYQIFEDDNQIRSTNDQIVELSGGDPLIVEIGDREPGATYQIDIEIYDEYDRLVYDATIISSDGG